LQGWQPVSAAAREFHAGTKLGQTVAMQASRPRNPQHHRKMFALLGIVADNCEQFSGPDDVLLAVKATLGHGRWIKLEGASREIFAPDSINFASMNQQEFEPFYDAAVKAVQRWWLPADNEAIREAVEGFAA
jgi:hypothetical protein